MKFKSGARHTKRLMGRALSFLRNTEKEERTASGRYLPQKLHAITTEKGQCNNIREH